jgi:acetone carboxylase gamma subunit
MRRQTTLLLILSLLGGGATAQEPGPRPRLIAPDQFPAYPSGEEGAIAKRTAIILPTKERPYGNCDRASRLWLTCLNATAGLSDSLIDQAETRVRAAIALRTDVSSFMRDTFAKALIQADTQWRTLRDYECSELVLLEKGFRAQPYELRLTCRIRHNLDRAEELWSRYGFEGPQLAPARSPVP